MVSASSSAQGLTRVKLRSQLGKIHFPAHLGCWPSLVPCGCRSEVPLSLVAAAGAVLSS